MKLINPIESSSQLYSLYSSGKKGYIANIKYNGNKSPLKGTIKLHKTSCMYCNPHNLRGIKPERKIPFVTGELLYAETLKEAYKIIFAFQANGQFFYYRCYICKP